MNFYDGTTSKPHLKRKLQEKNVPTSSFVEIRQGHEEEDIIKAEDIVGYDYNFSILTVAILSVREVCVVQDVGVLLNR